MTQTRPMSAAIPSDVAGRRPRWPLTASAAGLLGLVATMHDPVAGADGTTGDATLSVLSGGAGLLLVVTAAVWRRFVEPRTRASTAAQVVPLALVVSATALVLGEAGGVAGWVGVMGAATALAWMGLRERTVSRSVTAVSLLAVAAVPVAPALAGPVWLLVVGLALTFGRSTIAR